MVTSAVVVGDLNLVQYFWIIKVNYDDSLGCMSWCMHCSVFALTVID
jgi:hypothetical protein